MPVKAKLAAIVMTVLCHQAASQVAPPESRLPAADTTATTFLRIGYLPSDAGPQSRPATMNALRDSLLSSPAVIREMATEGVTDISVLVADSHPDLVQRMDQGEFDLVFCTSIDFVSQEGPYEVVFQLRRTTDKFDPQGTRVWQHGAIFVNNRSPLFRANLGPQAMADHLLTAPLALVGTHSASGFLYPSLRIAGFTGGRLPSRIMFCDTPDEVVRYVINGVAEAGACEEGAIHEVLEAAGLAGRRDELLQIVLQTDPIPTDPVVMHARVLPRQSPLGREIREGVRSFFAGRPDLPALQNSSSDRYADLRVNLRRYRDLRQYGILNRPAPAGVP